MTRRKLLLSAAGLVAAFAVPAAAGNVESDVTARLAREGFRITSRRRTWLGRVRIQAGKGKLQREVVFDPTSGEILRDYINDSGGVQIVYQGTSTGNGSSTTGSNPDGDGGVAGEEPSEEPGREPAEEPGREPSKEPSREPAREPSKEPAKEPDREPAREPSKEPSREPSKEQSREPAKEPGGESSKGRSRNRTSKSKEASRAGE
jgi:hypothetical protein